MRMLLLAWCHAAPLLHPSLHAPCPHTGPQVQQAKAQQAQREVERLQRSLSARDALIQQLKTQRANDTPAREVSGAGGG